MFHICSLKLYSIRESDSLQACASRRKVAGSGQRRCSEGPSLGTAQIAGQGQARNSEVSSAPLTAPNTSSTPNQCSSHHIPHTFPSSANGSLNHGLTAKPHRLRPPEIRRLRRSTRQRSVGAPVRFPSLPCTPPSLARTSTNETSLCDSEAWRYTGPFTRWNRLKGMFPGFGIAAVAFAGYLVYEQVAMAPSQHGHGEGEGHH